MGSNAAFVASLLCILSISGAAAQVIDRPAVVLGEGEVRVAREVRPGEPFLSMPIRHSRTGVLQNDLYSDGLEIRRTLFAPRGSRAIWLGYFVPRGNRNGQGGGDLWCFVSPGGAPSMNDCVWGRTAVFVNPLYVSEINQSWPAAYQRILTENPVIVEEPSEEAADIRLVFSLLEWRDGELWYTVRGGGLFSRAPLEADGSALIHTPAGPIRLARGSDPDEAVVVASTNMSTWGSLDREIIEHRTHAIQALPYPVIAATTNAPSDTDFRSIVSGDVILEQEVRAATVFRAAQTLRDGHGDPIIRRGDLFAGHEVEDRLIVCPIGSVRSTSCFEDKDDAPGYDYTYSVVRHDESTLYLRRIAQQYVVDSVRIEPAPNAVPPSEMLRLTYLGVATTGGATYARFSWTGATRRNGAYGARSVIVVRLDEHGAARLTANGGDLIGEFRLVDGQAMYRSQGGIPARGMQPISREGQLLEMLRGFEAASGR